MNITECTPDTTTAPPPNATAPPGPAPTSCSLTVFNETTVCTNLSHFVYQPEFVFDFDFNGETGRYFKSQLAAVGPAWLEVDTQKVRLLR